ncbi:NPP1 family protein [Spongiactinospora rosea]|uniref:NPP1 family protein n=1 Tax=Spongiactinospora rosea TaxID=2248750 RepID=UPI001CECF714|nr:NPP1 family protein [Spongiactinospora rosea]
MSAVTAPPAWAEPPPPKLPANASEAQLRYQPAMDYDGDGCYPSVAIGPDGTLNPGLKPSGALDGACHDESDLENVNMYARSRCNTSGWCVHLYGLYFQKDQKLPGAESGHRHDWEHIAVWVKDGEVKYVGPSAHGHYNTRPVDEVELVDRTHPKIVYHKDGLETHAFRLARAGEEAENPRGWQLPDLVSWNGYPSTELRDKLSAHDWGSATFALKDDEFPGELDKAHKYEVRPTRGSPYYLDWSFEFDVDRHELPSGMSDPNTPRSDEGGEAELAKRDLRVLPLGDSITYGNGSSTNSGYRGDLWAKLKAKSLDFVGSQRSGRLPDTDNEGHPGAMISEIAQKGVVAAQRWRPNVVLVHAGTNDMSHGNAGAARDALAALIDDIHQAAPDATVVVADLVPSRNAAVQGRIQEFNTQIRGVVLAYILAGRHVLLADMSAVKPGDLSDDLHPNDSGYGKMADAFYTAIVRAAAGGWIKDPSGGTTCTDTPGSWNFRGRIATGVGHSQDERIDFADIDGDGRDDYLVVDVETGAVRAWINNGGDGGGGWTARGRIAVGIPHSDTEVIDFADIDGDGRDDYLVVDVESRAVRAWINNGGDGGGGWTARGRIAVGVEGQSRPVFADVDGDGRDDYLVVSDIATGAVNAWINKGGDGGGGWTARGRIAAGVASPQDGLTFANVDCDRRDDYLVTGYPSGSVRAWLNRGGDGGGGWTARGQIAAGIGIGSGQGLTFADIDGDGRDDYLIYDVAIGSVRAWINNGGDPA